VFNDLPDTGGDACASGKDKVHSKRMGSFQGLFHFRHNIQGLIVGIQEQLELMIAGLEGGTEIFGAGQFPTFFSRKQALPNINHPSHDDMEFLKKKAKDNGRLLFAFSLFQ
jgi:hypothetical protein